jgi:4a-hydroxytetrahydrobiopterin dehydratase
MPLHDDEIRMALRDLPGWRWFGGALHKEFGFRGFRSAIAFINRVAERSIGAGHHPDIETHGSRVLLSLTTNDEGGVTERDIALAHEIERVVEPAGSDVERASTGETGPD